VNLPLSLDKWDTIGVTPVKETFLDKECFRLPSGSIVAKDVTLLDGTLELDISFPEGRSFPGFALRMQDPYNFESFYVRPHQSGNPDASQYTPVFNGEAGWQLYYGEGYSGAFTFKFNQWHHIKIELHGLQAEFYIDGTAVIKVKELLAGYKPGRIGIISEGANLRVANIQYTNRQGSTPTSIPVPPNGSAGLITQWQISNAVNRKLFDGKFELTPELKKNFGWTRQTSEPSGTINFARFGKWSETTNLMAAKLTIESAVDQVKAIAFGFSDYVSVYLNDKIIYSGSDNFRSRDYRFLGTIGFFDKVYLPLKKGVNELWFLVSEDFGGWGIKAKFDNMDNISLP
ncbi:MAG TPA: family 16 glycoside hydrolase, partial [Puia sp.]|nr:family 16 glycoside hydrolase [Puia sp.]